MGALVWIEESVARSAAVRWIVEAGEIGTLGVVPSDLSRGVALVGDSLAVGLTPPLSAEFSDLKFSAASKGGTDMRAWLVGGQAPRLDQILSQKPAVVLVSLGTNDTAPASQPNAETIRSRLLELVAKVRASGAEPVWLLPGKLPWSTAALDAAVKESGVSAIEQPAEVQAYKKYDPVHPSGEGYKVWSAAIAKSLRTARSTPGVSRGAGLGAGALIIGAGVAILLATLAVRGAR